VVSITLPICPHPVDALGGVRALHGADDAGDRTQHAEPAAIRLRSAMDGVPCDQSIDAPPEADGPIRVVVCDDAPAIRALIRCALEFDGRVEIVGEAADGEAVVALVAELRPDAVLLDLSMPNVDGLAALPRILEAAPWVGVVVLSGRDEAESAPLALALGAERYMAKPAGVAAIRDAVLDVGLRAP
jgi:CheY-like chemotaxis protein